MKLSLLGLEITRAPKGSRTIDAVQYPTAKPMVQRNHIANPAVGTVTHSYSFAEGHILHEVNWPQSDATDPWVVFAQKKAIKAFLEKFKTDRYSSGWFSICEVDTIMKVFGISMRRQDSPAYEKLRLLHCVHFDEMDPVLYVQIPALMNEVFGTTVQEEPSEEEVEVMPRSRSLAGPAIDIEPEVE